VQREQLSEGELLDAAIQTLTARLPPDWAVEKTTIGEDPEPRDMLIKTPRGSGQAVVLVEARPRVSARDVQVLMGGPWRRWRRQSGNQPILLVAPYIAPRVRDLLMEENVSYLDLTGNIRITLDYPGVFIEAQGAQRDPSLTKKTRGLGGAKVGSVIRLLVDFEPPYTGAEIARGARVNEGYASRILDTLQDEGLIERDPSGPIRQVEWPGLLRRRAQEIDLFRETSSLRFIARQGARQAIEGLKSLKDDPPPTITGSFAAARLSPVAAPILLAVYTSSARELADDLNLLPAEAGADTALIRPDNPVVYERATKSEGLWYAAPSQIAIDCLAGSGRMPAEGEEVISWMQENQSEWRRTSIQDLLGSDGGRHG
jgi:hypothetical protein